MCLSSESEGKHMNNKIKELFGYLKGLCYADIDRVIEYVSEILKINNQQADRPNCPHCLSTQIIKNGHKDGKQRFFFVMNAAGLICELPIRSLISLTILRRYGPSS